MIKDDSSDGTRIKWGGYMICKYVDQRGLAAMLGSKRSAGVAPEVKLRITQVRKHTSKGSTLALKSGADITRSPK